MMEYEGKWYPVNKMINSEINKTEFRIAKCLKKYREDQVCRFCLDPESILTPETCCTGCSKLK